MKQSRSIAREIALLVLGQISDKEINSLESSSLELLLNKALDSLSEYWREGLDNSAKELENAQQHLLDSELKDADKSVSLKVRSHLAASINDVEKVLNGLSSSIELSRLLMLCDQEEIRLGAMKRMSLVLADRELIDFRLNEVMEGWRLGRLPRIDRDILRLAFIDMVNLHTPAAVACNEAVELANRYSDDSGRRMINGVLRRLQNSSPKII